MSQPLSCHGDMCKIVIWIDNYFSDRATWHYSDIKMSMMASKITGVWIVCTIVCSGADQRKYQSSASLAFVRGIHWWPVDCPHKGPVIWKMFPFDYVIMIEGQEPLCEMYPRVSNAIQRTIIEYIMMIYYLTIESIIMSLDIHFTKRRSTWYSGLQWKLEWDIVSEHWKRNMI